MTSARWLAAGVVLVSALALLLAQGRSEARAADSPSYLGDAVCAACHAMIDPAGFALEGFDAIGRSRVVDEYFRALDTSGALPDGTAFDGAAELRAALVERPERFVSTVTEKLMTYALGRGLDYYDMPAVRRIVREAEAGGYGMQSIILGIVNSYPFLHRRSES